jgi:integrase
MKFEFKEKTVTLMIGAKIGPKWVRRRVIYGKNGRVVPGLVLIGGKEVHIHKCRYDIRYFVNGQAKYLPAGYVASDAEELRKTFAAQLSVKAVAAAAGLMIPLEPNRKTVKQASIEYLKSRYRELGTTQIGNHKYVMRLFGEVCSKIYVDEIVRNDLLKFLDHVSVLPVLRDRRRRLSLRRGAVLKRKRYPVSGRTLSPRTTFNYFIVLCKWLKEIGVDPGVFPDPPKFEEPEITIYSAEQLKVLFELLEGSLRIALSLMLKCGLRNKEVAFACFSDVDFEDKTFLVQGKPEYGFRVKNYAQRYVPIPDDLLDELKEWRATHPRQALIVPNVNGKPDTKILERLKRFVYLHGLRCGRCGHCVSGNPNCEEWECHKFRRNYATTIVRKYDLRTAQQYLGHKRITSTERYLRAFSAIDGQKRASQIDFTNPFDDEFSRNVS